VQDVEDVRLEIRSILYYMQDCVVSRRLHVHLHIWNCLWLLDEEIKDAIRPFIDEIFPAELISCTRLMIDNGGTHSGAVHGQSC
jgi:hypothetical protein